MVNAIVDACCMHGAYTLSVGTFEPAVVLRRLLHAWRVLDPIGYERSPLTASDVPAIPEAALTEPEHLWWGSETATSIVEEVVCAIGQAVGQYGLCVNVSEPDRLELTFLDISDHSAQLPPEGPSTHTSPAFSALRRRVRPR